MPRALKFSHHDAQESKIRKMPIARMRVEFMTDTTKHHQLPFQDDGAYRVEKYSKAKAQILRSRLVWKTKGFTHCRHMVGLVLVITGIGQATRRWGKT